MMKRTRSLSLSSLLCAGTCLTAMACARPNQAAPKPPEAPKATPAKVAHGLDDVDGAVDAPVGAPVHALSSKVTKVTVYSDRARVTRAATAEVSTEPKVFAFEGLPGWVDDASVRVSASAGRIIDVRVDRSFLAKAQDETRRKAEAHHQALQNKLAALNDELAVLDAQKNQIEAIKAFSLEKIGKDTTIGDVSVESYSDVLTFISDALRSTAKSRRAAQLKIDEVTPEFTASQRTLVEMESLGKLEQTTVLVTLQASQAASSAVALTYMMPGATWEPLHELRATTSDPEAVDVLSFAMVSQTSGEDWDGAELSFSTQSSTQAVRIPELDALVLGNATTASRTLKTQQSSFTRAQQAFQGQSGLWNKVHNKSKMSSEKFEQVYQENLQFLQVVQSKTVRIFDSLKNRGTTDHFKALAAPSVRGDGHPVRMRIGSSTLKSRHKVIAVPEQSLNAARSLQMVNSTGQSFLPGKVALYQDGDFLGVTEVDFIAEGETFAVFLSVADHIKLSRKLDRKQSALTRGKRNKMQVGFIVTVENLSADPTTFSLADRVPVSENKDIRVDRVKVSDGVRPDRHGLLHWDLTLQPKERRQFRVSYQVEYPAELVLEARRRRSAEPAASPASPAKARAYRLDEELADIESQL